MLKIYEYHGKKWQFEEGEQPVGAVEVKQAKTADKAAKPANRTKKATTK
ncbi:MAG: hypothetical protein IJ113_01035 [Eggerthellaceae bacterium]|nr:hypothetical protein [Eggerthellaceae bacterium]